MKVKKTAASLTMAAVLAGGFVAQAATPVNAAGPATGNASKQAATALPLPINGVDQYGQPFSGTITQLSTYVDGGQLMAKGVVRTVDAAGNTVGVPFTTQITDASTNGTRQTGKKTTGMTTMAAPTIPAGCNVLNLELAPLQLDLLGLVVTLPNPLVIDITAVPGSGNLLGNLVCSVGGLLDQGGLLGGLVNGVSTLLNRLLAGLGLA